ncbi:unnamed protein product [Didymodactylos carnosus]|uniref:Uncharacterized protein n=1 Tax=Didymodactylos carnosus TaxID=1234261 RepID=A0A814SRU1_9BILA|nr:unnamed protein product [Didymodactylos carnosus]CAF1151973.1 unnamed protein product [Didymodactylos carnosus]CAF3709593.1 unnamed protein product [Didymodactylos carnosus]CAF3915565.1 unnamed protein product [Didymodactylos carnosus]
MLSKFISHRLSYLAGSYRQFSFSSLLNKEQQGQQKNASDINQQPSHESTKTQDLDASLQWGTKDKKEREELSKEEQGLNKETHRVERLDPKERVLEFAPSPDQQKGNKK